MRRRSPEPPPGPPEIELTPGLTAETLAELAPLLAEEGIDLDTLDAADPDTVQRALNRAVERHNLARFTPVGRAREQAVGTLRRVVEAIAAGDTAAAAAILDAVPPESPDASAPTVAGCIGLSLGLLDDWLCGQAPPAPPDLGAHVRLPAGHWVGGRAATDIVVLARKGRAFRSLGMLIVRQGGKDVLYGGALALTAALQVWSDQTGAGVPGLARAAVR